jgi:acetyl esterase/lipase
LVRGAPATDSLREPGVGFDPAAMARRLREMGTDMSPQAIVAYHTLYSPYHEREPYEGVRVIRDVAYGDHERQRLDVYMPLDALGDRLPVLVFVHGGGFVGGDKHHAGTPYFDNVGLWAVHHGLLGVNMTYRLAPEFQWPAGQEDVAGALAWVRERVDQFGGDPGLIHLMGTSAGAAHVASYVAERVRSGGDVGIVSGIMLSGIYDLTTAGHWPQVRTYFGDEPATFAERSSLGGLLKAEIPLLFVLAEIEPEQFEQQALELVSRYYERHSRWPRFMRLTGHNHFTTAVHLNTPDEPLGHELVDFTSNASRPAKRS